MTAVSRRTVERTKLKFENGSFGNRRNNEKENDIKKKHRTTIFDGLQKRRNENSNVQKFRKSVNYETLPNTKIDIYLLSN